MRSLLQHRSKKATPCTGQSSAISGSRVHALLYATLCSRAMETHQTSKWELSITHQLQTKAYILGVGI
jgi:hypothetical protein